LRQYDTIVTVSHMAIKFGLVYEICRPEPFDGFLSEAEAYWQALEQCVLADELGFDHVWEVEHHFLEGYSISSAPEVFLSAVAQQTKRIRVGNGVRLLPPPFNHPARSAEMAAVLDIMSHGRYDFGVGRSITEAELGGFGVDPAHSRPMLDEVLPEIVRMWTENPYPGFDGTYFSMPARPVLPKPLQDPHPPIWMACTQPASFDLAADFGIGVLAFGVGAPGNVVESLKRYKQRIKNPTRQVGGFVNDAVAPATVMYCAEDEREALEMGGVAALWYGAQTAKLFAPWMGKDVEGYRYYTELVHDPEFLAQFQVPFEERLRDEYSLVGTPDKVAQGVQSYVDIGADQIICLVQAGRIPHERIMDSLRLFGTEVIPRFRPPRDAGVTDDRWSEPSRSTASA
jgi:alkanesulfonate monooxygenase SsuD/methylene tetrahydromethanopterin reductase-like flavin-dependent oxidoreductase (luciferase family)